MWAGEVTSENCTGTGFPFIPFLPQRNFHIVRDVHVSAYTQGWVCCLLFYIAATDIFFFYLLQKLQVVSARDGGNICSHELTGDRCLVLLVPMRA